MKRQGTSQFVKELITNWLKEISNPTILDEFEELIKQRRKMLMIIDKDEREMHLLAALKDCKSGDTLYLMKALPKPATSLKTDDAGTRLQKKYATAGTRLQKKYAVAENRMQCQFWQWMPRKKILWVTVPWTTSRKIKWGYNFIRLNVRDIKEFEPSRTETDIRLKTQHRN